MFAPHLSAMFSTIGAAATYVPPSGVPVALRAIRQGGGQVVKIGQVDVVLDRVRFDVLRSAVAAPIPGATIEVAGVIWTIQGHQPCEKDSHGLKWSLDVAWGAPVIWRSVAGQGNSQTPPSITGSVAISVDAATGAQIVSVSADYIVGKLAAGDAITIGATVHTIIGPVQGANNAFAAVPITPALTADVAVGQAVTLAFSRDTTISAAISSYQAHELTGGVVAGDIRLVVLASSVAPLPEPPKVGDLVKVGGRTMAAKNCSPLYAGANLAAWEVQAR